MDDEEYEAEVPVAEISNLGENVDDDDDDDDAEIVVNGEYADLLQESVRGSVSEVNK